MSVVTLLTVADVQALLPGLSTRTVKEELHRSGLAVKVRGKLYITADNFAKFLEAHQCPSKSNGATASPTYRGPLAVTAYEEALKLATEHLPKSCAPRPRPVLSVKPSTAKGRKRHLQTPPSNILKLADHAVTLQRSSRRSDGNA
jgi:hypothetical protein